MAGFPFFQLDRFLKVLVQDMNKYVAISEEFVNNVVGKAKSGGLMFDRRVARIVTPGTLIDEKFMDPYENNFLLSVHIKPIKKSEHKAHAISGDQPIGLSWLDLSTGDFFTQSTTAQFLPSAIAAIGAREVVVDERMSERVKEELQLIVGADRHLLTSFSASTPKNLSQWGDALESPLSPESSSAFASEETAACSLLLEYAQTQMQGLRMKLQPPRRKHLDESMTIDRNSLRGLEILETARDGFGKGSLLHAVRRTSTKSGARLLRERLTAPSASLQVINGRLDLVSEFFENEELREIIIVLLKRSHDVQRLVQKFSLGRGDADDLVCLSRAIEASKNIKETISTHIEQNNRVFGREAMTRSLQTMIDRIVLSGPEDLSQRILNTIDEEGLLQRQRAEENVASSAASLAQDVVLSEGTSEDMEAMPKKVRDSHKGQESTEPDGSEIDTWIMRREATPVLARLHDDLNKLYGDKQRLTQELRDASNVPTLTLKWTPGLGHVVHMKGVRATSKAVDALGATRTVSSSKSTRSFYLSSWTQLGAAMDNAKWHIRIEEQRIFETIRESVILNLIKLRRNAAVLDGLDVACSFAVLAQEQHWTRPIVTTSTSHRIFGGRHPTVKLGLEEAGRSFVSNDCFLDAVTERILLITGPNMAGKSTFLRQNALITVLAQTGSFVPAAHAEIGIVDRIFSRIGAADDLFRDQSTFMVEMLETAAILRQATPRSFVIMDEVGRGTTPEDGAAVGFGCLWHLHEISQCRTLFATHFHALADMTAGFTRLGRYCTDVREDGKGGFFFDHKLRAGVNRQSHALKVARLAGMPESVIDVAREVLDRKKGGTDEEQKRATNQGAS